MTVDIVFGRGPVHNYAFSFVSLYIFTRFGLAFTLKRSNGGLGSKKKKSSRKQRLIVLMRTGKKRGFSKALTSELVKPLQAKSTNVLYSG